MARKRPVAVAQKKSRRGWIVFAVIVGILIIGGVLGRVATPLLVISVLLAVGLGLFTVIKGATPRLGMRSRKSGFVALGAAVLLIVGGGAANATPSNSPQAPAALMEIAPEPNTPKKVDTPTPTPIPTTYEQVNVDTPIPFERTTLDDASLAEGTTTVTTTGVDGTMRATYKVTYVDGEETSRELIEEAVFLNPISEVTTRGTLKPVAAPVPLVQNGGGKCDSNYTGACVPIASDVDCAGGSGNGPAYLDGQARVVGSDIYDLDRDNNGIACD